MNEVLTWFLDRLHNMGLSPDAESLAAGLLFGERSMLSSDAMHDIRDAGMSHLLAVSGLHIGLLWAMVLYPLRLLLLIPYRMNWYTVPWNDAIKVLSLLILWLYVWMIGLPPSAVRAAIMITISQISSILSLNAWGWHNLITAALLMLSCDPRLITNVGFQLSFGATAGILAFHPMLSYHVDRTMKYRKKTFWEWLRPLKSIFLLTIAAQWFTFPLCAYYFHHVPLFGWIQGLAVVPLLPILLYGLVLLLLLPSGLGLLQICGENLYHWLSMPVEVLVWWTLKVAHWVSSLELWIVGGRVEFYPSIGEVIGMEIIMIGLLVSYFGYRRQHPDTPLL